MREKTIRNSLKVLNGPEHGLRDAQHAALATGELHRAPPFGPQASKGVLHEVEMKRQIGIRAYKEIRIRDNQ